MGGHWHVKGGGGGGGGHGHQSRNWRGPEGRIIDCEKMTTIMLYNIF